MNIERLHKIVNTLKTDIEQSKLMEVFGTLVSHLSQLSSEPGNATHQTNVSSSRKTLLLLLLDFPTSDYPPSWRHTLEEIGLGWFVAANLVESVNDAFEDAEIAPAAAQTALQDILSVLQGDMETVNQLIASLVALDIGKEEMVEGECEISVSFNAAAFDSDLVEFGKRVLEIEKLVVKPFSIMTTSSAKNLKLKSISSSDFIVIFQLVTDNLFDAAKTTAAIALAVRFVIQAYKEVKSLKKSQSVFAEDEEAPDDLLKEMDDFVEGKIDKALDKAVKELISRYCSIKSPTKLNPLKVSLRKSLKKIAKWINEGSSIETRMEKLTATESHDEVGGDQEPVEELEGYFEEINEAHRVQITFEADSEPLLKIESSEDEEPE